MFAPTLLAVLLLQGDPAPAAVAAPQLAPPAPIVDRTAPPTGGKAPDVVAAAKPEASPAARAPSAVPTPRPKSPEVPSYRVSLKMKSGRRFAGIVGRDKRFHESVHAGAHHSAPIYATSERFTLRWVDGLDGDIELCWNQVEKLDVREILDSGGLRAMENRYAVSRIARRQQAEAEAVAEAAGDRAEPAADGGEPAAKDGTPAAEAGDVKSPRADVAPPRLSLLTEFAPEQGWSPERKKQIEWRRTVVGSFPDEREARFLEVFDQWEPLFADWTRQKEAESAAAGAKGNSTPSEAARNEPKPAVPNLTKPEEPPAPGKPAEKTPSDGKPADKPAAKPATSGGAKEGAPPAPARD